jgi:uncharacterized protein YdhG (YjbR/CyaY superfamily)
MTKAADTVDAYIAAQPARTRAKLDDVRKAIRKALPKAREVISYKIPAYKNGDRTVLYFAGWKNHYALYPFGERIVKAFKKELAPYKVAGSTIRFPMSAPVPARLIARIAKFRAKDIAAPRRAKAAGTRKTKKSAPKPAPRGRKSSRG